MKTKFRFKFKRRYFVIFAFVFLCGFLLAYQNCAGTRDRTSDLDVSLGQVESTFNQVQCGTSDQQGQTTESTFIDIFGQPDSEIFFTQAPSSMGNIDLVAPMDYAGLRQDGGQNPQTVYGFFTVGADGRAALVVGVSDTAATASSTITTGTGTGSTVVAQKFRQTVPRLMRSTQRAVRAASAVALAGTASCSGNTLNINTTISPVNDGSAGAEPANFDDGEFEMEMNYNGNLYRLHSFDVVDGDFDDTIQLELDRVDPNTGAEIFVGDINLTQPSD